MYTHLEQYIYELYRNMNIVRPEQLDMRSIAKKLKINIYYGNFNMRYGNNIILAKTTKQQQWVKFAHETGHYLRHCGHQLDMNPLFFELQEYQANHFAYHFCVPTFMLDQLKGVTVYDIMNLFNVEYEFALRRLEMHQNKYFERSVIHGKRTC